MARSLNAAGWLERSTGHGAQALKSFEEAAALAEEIAKVARLTKEALRSTGNDSLDNRQRAC